MAVRIRPAVVSRRPHAAVTQPMACSAVGAVWVRSTTVSSTRVRGNSGPGWVAIPARALRWMTTPGIDWTRRLAGTVM
jgi:hypothetical protein